MLQKLGDPRVDKNILKLKAGCDLYNVGEKKMKERGPTGQGKENPEIAPSNDIGESVKQKAYGQALEEAAEKNNLLRLRQLWYSNDVNYPYAYHKEWAFIRAAQNNALGSLQWINQIARFKIPILYLQEAIARASHSQVKAYLNDMLLFANKGLPSFLPLKESQDRLLRRHFLSVNAGIASLSEKRVHQIALHNEAEQKKNSFLSL